MDASKKDLIANKVKQLNEELKTKKSYLGEIYSAVKKLKADAKKLLEDINMTMGAAQAYSEALRLMEDSYKVLEGGDNH